MVDVLNTGLAPDPSPLPMNDDVQIQKDVLITLRALADIVERTCGTHGLRTFCLSVCVQMIETSQQRIDREFADALVATLARQFLPVELS